MRLLLIEDDVDTAAYVLRGLRQDGHLVDHCDDGHEALTRVLSESYDVLVIDRMLPGLDGVSVVRSMRQAEVKTPVLFLTALGGIGDRVEGLKAGGDDYLVKPFAFSELVARLEALARRPPLSHVVTIVRVGDLEMDLLARRVRRGAREVALKNLEFRLLEFLMRHAGHIVTRTMLLESVWEFHFEPKTKIVETQISRLRAKIEGANEPPLIHTVRGQGYVIRAPA